jgi:neutral ceramidase
VKRGALVGAALLAGFLLVGSAIDVCPPPAAEEGLTRITRAQGALLAGAAKVSFSLPAGPMAGYSPLRQSASPSAERLQARAVVLEVEGTRFGLLTLDMLLVPPDVAANIRQAFDFEVWVVATHTHSGPGGIEHRLFAQLVATGPHRPATTEAIIHAGREALSRARLALTPSTFSISEIGISQRVWARTGTAVDERLTTARFSNLDGGVDAEWLILAAHPTLVPRSTTAFDGDYPRRLAGDDDVVRLVFQGAGGNAAAAAESVELFLERLGPSLAERTFVTATTPIRLGLASGHLPLGRPFGPRAVPWALRPLAQNIMCDDAQPNGVVSALELGPLRLLSVPFEASAEAGHSLEKATSATRLITLANGYEGYLEPPAIVEASVGESALQYYAADMLPRLTRTAQSVAEGAFSSPAR